MGDDSPVISSAYPVLVRPAFEKVRRFCNFRPSDHVFIRNFSGESKLQRAKQLRQGVPQQGWLFLRILFCDCLRTASSGSVGGICVSRMDLRFRNAAG